MASPTSPPWSLDGARAILGYLQSSPALGADELGVLAQALSASADEVEQRLVQLDALLKQPSRMDQSMDLLGWVLGIGGFGLAVVRSLVAGTLDRLGGIALLISVCGLFRAALVHQRELWARQDRIAERDDLRERRATFVQIERVLAAQAEA